MVSFLMAKIRWQDKTNFYFRRHPPNSIYFLLQLNLRLLITVGFGISKANSSRNNELAPRSWPAFTTSIQMIPCCMLKEDRVWPKLPLLAVSHFPSLSIPCGICWHPKALRNSKGLLSWQPRQQLTSACCLLLSPYPPFLPVMYCPDQRSGDKYFRGRIVYLLIQMLIFKAPLRVLSTQKR